MRVRGGSAAARGSAMLAGALMAGFVAATPGPASALTLAEALADVYADNPELAAEVRALRATNEAVASARTGLRPEADATARTGLSYERDQDGNDGTAAPRALGAEVTQPLFDGGRTPARIRQARQQVAAARAQLARTEQSVLLDGVRAYADVLRDQEIVELRKGSERVLEQQLAATRDRFEVGEVTRREVEQAEASLAGARASRIEAEGNLAAARGRFREVVGRAPPADLPAPEDLAQVPESLAAARELAGTENPRVRAAEFQAEAAAAGIDVARSALMPSASLSASAEREWRDASRDHTDTLQVTARLSVPLYSGGTERSSVREAKEERSQQRLNVETARRAAVQRTTRAWQTLQSARSAISAREQEVTAAEIALESAQQEFDAGAATVLDVLDAEQSLLEAELALVRSRRDARVAAFDLMAATGSLTARQLELDVTYYEPGPDLDAVADRWLGLEAVSEDDTGRGE